jgi:hypothetical protein
MKSMFTGAVGAALLGLLAMSQPALAQQKTAKECASDWTANKASLQASGKTRKAYIAECRGLPAAAAPAAPAAPAGKGQFATEAEAKASCPSDAVVWVNLRSKVYHARQGLQDSKARRDLIGALRLRILARNALKRDAIVV